MLAPQSMAICVRKARAKPLGWLKNDTPNHHILMKLYY
jgi:hypothetical protein